MPLVLMRLVDKDIIDLFEEIGKKAEQELLKISKKAKRYDIKSMRYTRNITI